MRENPLFEINEDPKLVERALMVGIRWRRQDDAEVIDHLEELEQLLDTLGIPVVGSEIAPLARPRPDLILGSGRAAEIVAECDRLDADCIVFDEDLSPTQQRNWEKLAKRCVIDRREVIIDIFAKRAQTREARLQTRLAQLEYRLPRLRRAWTHLERQRGGAGLRGGAGELQIEMDRRQIREFITSIKRELGDVRKRRSVQRKQREVKPTPNAAIVGYTNAGKSTLLRAMTGANVLVEDQLFATLDPTTRRIVLPNNQEILLTDTVGFIRKLPHGLVESFKATLEETRLADYLIHVVDVTHPKTGEHIEATRAVLKEIEAGDKPTVLVLNKIDRLENRADLVGYNDQAEHVVHVSAATGDGIENLIAALTDLRGRLMERMVLEVPADRYDVVSMAHREGNILFEGYSGQSTWVEVEVPARLHSRFEEYARPEIPGEVRGERKL